MLGISLAVDSSYEKERRPSFEKPPIGEAPPKVTSSPTARERGERSRPLRSSLED